MKYKITKQILGSSRRSARLRMQPVNKKMAHDGTSWR